MSGITAAGNRTETKKVVIKSGPNKGKLTTVHALADGAQKTEQSGGFGDVSLAGVTPDPQPTPWSRVEAALPAAKGMYFDGCHKIYLAMDAAENAKFASEMWPHTTAPDLGVLHTWFDESCPLRFITAVSTNLEDPNAGYERIIAQGETYEEADDAQDDEPELSEGEPESPVYTVSWENGVQMVEGIVVESRSAAYARLDNFFRGAEYPDSLRVVLYEDGKAFWSQMGSVVENV